ncbi:hypothetical protein J6590_010966 [Homalodisca vitripennis]|nr:hypothetical protein J6590_010966 [Homalodisca vitripennis]
MCKYVVSEMGATSTSPVAFSLAGGSSGPLHFEAELSYTSVLKSENPVAYDYFCHQSYMSARSRRRVSQHSGVQE